MQHASASAVIAGRYRLHGVLGRGGMGEVWDGTDLRLGRPVAVKLLKEDLARKPELRRRFEAEARAAAGLVHPNVVGVFDTGEQEGVPYIVMERLGGRTLADEIAEGPVTPRRVVTLARDVLAALEAAHQSGIVHRDVKPGNILLTDGSPGLTSAKVADFGIAKAAEGQSHDLTATGQMVGTPAYLAPERLDGGAATARSDLFAVGVVLYEALAGARPFTGDTPMSLAYAISHGEPPPLLEAAPGVDPALAATIERALEKDPDRRFASATEMARSLEEVVGPAPPSDGSTTRRIQLEAAPLPDPTETGLAPPAERARALPLRRTQRIALGAAAAILLLVLLAALMAGLAGDRDGTPIADEPATTSTADPDPAGPATLPEPLDRALRELEEAVGR